MKDDKFNDLMKKYVDSTKRGKEFDLQKLNNRSQDTAKERRVSPKLVWVSCAAILIIVISLSIALPIVLNKESEPEYYYCDLSNIDKIEINGFTELKDQHNFSCLLPTIEFVDSYMYIMSNKEDNKEIGAFVDLAIYDDAFDDITINIIKKSYIMVQFQYFDNFIDSVKWGDTIVKYLIGEKNDTYYSYEMTFAIGEYNYFINFDSFTEMSVIEVMDRIFS